MYELINQLTQVKMAEKIKIKGDPKTIQSLRDMERFKKIINRRELMRRIDFTSYHTFVSRLNHTTILNDNDDRIVFAKQMTEMMDELFYEIGVMIGRIRKNPHKKYKYLDVLDPDERSAETIERGD